MPTIGEQITETIKNVPPDGFATGCIVSGDLRLVLIKLPNRLSPDQTRFVSHALDAATELLLPPLTGSDYSPTGPMQCYRAGRDGELRKEGESDG